jgi:hypothetical protein
MNTDARLFTLVVVGALTLLGCGSRDVVSSEESGTEAEETSANQPADLPADDPRWCVDVEQGAEERMPTTEAELACAAKTTAETCEADDECTGVFGRGVQCTDAGACATEPVLFLGCVPFTICKQGAAIYCREIQGYLLTYASVQGGCTPFWMTNCETSPDHMSTGEPLPHCG